LAAAATLLYQQGDTEAAIAATDVLAVDLTLWNSNEYEPDEYMVGRSCVRVPRRTDDSLAHRSQGGLVLPWLKDLRDVVKVRKLTSIESMRMLARLGTTACIPPSMRLSTASVN
jgi:hypothetical protein